MRIALGMVGCQTNEAQQFGNPISRGRPLGKAVQFDRLGQQITDGHPGVERSKRILKDDLQARTDRAHLMSIQIENVAPFELDGPRAGRDEVQDQTPRRRFAASAFAHQGQRLAFRDREIQAVNRFYRADLALQDDPLLHRKMF